MDGQRIGASAWFVSDQSAMVVSDREVFEVDVSGVGVLADVFPGARFGSIRIYPARGAKEKKKPYP